jgi:3-hydroxyacyl-CoA dehydrogenase
LNDIIGIAGSGKMGNDIFNYLLDYDLDLKWSVSKNADTDELYRKIRKKIDRSMKNEFISTEIYERKINNIEISDDPHVLKDASLIIETIPEVFEKKTGFFGIIEDMVDEKCIFTTNSSSYKPSLFLPYLKRKDKFAGLHFFYPMKLKDVSELIVTGSTSGETKNTIAQFLKKIGKSCLFEDENDGFLLNKIFLELQVVAYDVYINSDLSAAEIDDIIKTGLSGVGAFELIDNVGVETLHNSINEYIRDYPDKEKYMPLKNCLANMLKNGILGNKNDTGFYKNPIGCLSKKTGNIEYGKDEIFKRLESVLNEEIKKIKDKNLYPDEEFDYAINQFLSV